MENNELNKNRACKNCGATLISGEEELCFRCWLEQESKRLKQENPKNQTPSNEEVNKDIPSINDNKYSLKDMGWILWGIISVIIILIFVIIGMARYFSNFINMAENISNGNIIVGIILLPLAIWGGIQMFRGFCEMCDNGKINSSLSFISTIAGYIALFYALTRI